VHFRSLFSSFGENHTIQYYGMCSTLFDVMPSTIDSPRRYGLNSLQKVSEAIHLSWEFDRCIQMFPVSEIKSPAFSVTRFI
jgi:hypothetical protein